MSLTLSLRSLFPSPQTHHPRCGLLRSMDETLEPKEPVVPLRGKAVWSCLLLWPILLEAQVLGRVPRALEQEASMCRRASPPSWVDLTVGPHRKAKAIRLFRQDQAYAGATWIQAWSNSQWFLTGRSWGAQGVPHFLPEPGKPMPGPHGGPGCPGSPEGPRLLCPPPSSRSGVVIPLGWPMWHHAGWPGDGGSAQVLDPTKRPWWPRRKWTFSFSILRGQKRSLWRRTPKWRRGPWWGCGWRWWASSPQRLWQWHGGEGSGHCPHRGPGGGMDAGGRHWPHEGFGHGGQTPWPPASWCSWLLRPQPLRASPSWAP